LQTALRRRLIDQGLRLRSVNGSIQLSAINVVNAHGSMVRAAHAAE
jgi:hypothetical protein